MPNTADANETLKRMQDRFQKFHNRKIQIETQRAETEKTLQKLQQDAESKFGSSDVEVLKKKLSEMKAENEKKVADYDKQLNEIEAKLAEVDQQHEGEGNDAN